MGKSKSLLSIIELVYVNIVIDEHDIVLWVPGGVAPGLVISVLHNISVRYNIVFSTSQHLLAPDESKNARLSQ